MPEFEGEALHLADGKWYFRVTSLIGPYDGPYAAHYAAYEMAKAVGWHYPTHGESEGGDLTPLDTLVANLKGLVEFHTLHPDARLNPIDRDMIKQAIETIQRLDSHLAATQGGDQ